MYTIVLDRQARRIRSSRAKWFLGVLREGAELRVEAGEGRSADDRIEDGALGKAGQPLVHTQGLFVGHRGNRVRHRPASTVNRRVE